MPNWYNIFAQSDIPAVIVAVFGLIYAFIHDLLPSLQYKKRHSLTYINYPILTPIIIDTTQTIGSDLRMSYQGEEIDNLRVTQIKFMNRSNLAIRKSLIIEPITFRFPSDAILLSEPKVISSKPSDLRVNWFSPKANVAILDFELLKKEELLIEFVWTGPKADPEITARIEGIIAINRATLVSQSPQRILRIVLPFIISILLVFGKYYLPIKGNQVIMAESLYSGAIYGLISAGILGIILSQIREARQRMAQQYNLFESFLASAHPPMTVSQIVRDNLLATFSCLFWTGLLIIAILAFIAVIPYIK